ncbi:MAG: mechanosensitive ion channel family protein [Parachlamydiaceae bacterium]|nr:mechanosensitive ion channel family protein [Parachlamydiaceae bacterium]
MIEVLERWQEKTLFIVVAVVVFNFLAKRVISRLHTHFEKRNEPWIDSFFQAIYLPVSVYTWFFAFVYALNMILSHIFSDWTFDRIDRVFIVGAILAIAWFVMRWKKALIRLSISKSKRHELAWDRGRIDVIDKLGTIFVLFMTILLLMEVTDRSMNTLIAFGGIGGLALAIASQEIIGNFFGGFMIYMTHPFSVGDWVKVPSQNIEGHVEEIGWYMTRIRTFAKRPIYVPNSTFAKSVVETPSRMSNRQLKETIGLRYRDVPVIKEVISDLKQMLKVHPGIDQGLPVLVHLEGFSHALEVTISIYTIATDTETYSDVKQDVLLKVIEVLEKHHAEMASPTAVVEIPDIVKVRTTG